MNENLQSTERSRKLQRVDCLPRTQLGSIFIAVHYIQSLLTCHRTMQAKVVQGRSSRIVAGCLKVNGCAIEEL